MRIAAVLTLLILILVLVGPADSQQLFVALESDLPAYVTDLSGFPAVTWAPLWNFGASGAAADPEGTLYLCEGAFTTHLHVSTDLGAPQQVATLSVDITGLAFGRGALYGYSNYATPKGIYRIDTTTGECTPVLDVYTNTGYRFFAFDYNPEDDLFYGFTEYGNSGLYSINIDTGEMIRLSGGPAGFYGMARGLAVGDNTVYLSAVASTDPYYAYDLSQGVGGSWVAFTNPYPGLQVTGAAAWIPGGQTPARQSNWGGVKGLFR